jgi:hypothetical protein
MRDQFVVPNVQVFVRDFAGHIETEDATVGGDVVGGVHGLEPFLAGRVLNWKKKRKQSKKERASKRAYLEDGKRNERVVFGQLIT